jgi:hypothetical protein
LPYKTFFWGDKGDFLTKKKEFIMNSNVTESRVRMASVELEQLTQEVKETVAVETVENQKAFTAANLWHIQRQMRTAYRQMQRWSMN